MTGWMVFELYESEDGEGGVEHSDVFLNREDAVKEFNSMVNEEKSEKICKSCKVESESARLHVGECYVHIWIEEVEINGGD